MLGFLLKIFPGKLLGPARSWPAEFQALRMCESAPHPRPRGWLTHSLPPAQGSQSGITASPNHLKLKILLLINSPSPPNSPQNKYLLPSLGSWGGVGILGPALLVGQPPSVKNRSLTPQGDPHGGISGHLSEWGLVSSLPPKSAWPPGPLGRRTRPPVQMLQFLSQCQLFCVSQREAPFLF